MLLLQASLLFRLLLLSTLDSMKSEAVALKVAVVLDGAGSVNLSLINSAFVRRVADNWRLGSGRRLLPVVLNASSMESTSASCQATAAVRMLCAHSNLSALIAVGRCSFLAELRSAAASMQVPTIALPTGLCSEAKYAYSLTGSHSLSQIVAVAAAVLAEKEATGSVALLFDGQQDSSVLMQLQDALTRRGLPSVALQIDNPDLGSGNLRSDLATLLSRLMKKRLRRALVLSEPSNALKLLAIANSTALLQQNYFWLLLDTAGLCLGQLKALRLPVFSNVALLRGGATATCSGEVLDAFGTCDTDWIRSLDVRFVDAVEAIAKALNDSTEIAGFETSNATCDSGKLQAWSSGPEVFARLAGLTNYNPGRGAIGFNSSSGHFDAQSIELVGAFNEQRSAPTAFVRSAVFHPRSNSLTVLFHRRGASLVFPNTLVGFNNETLVICAPVYPPFTKFEAVYTNNTVIVSGMLRDLLDILAEKMQFRYITKTPDDGQWGGPHADNSYYTGCVGEVQRDICQLAGGPFVKTTTRDRVIDYAPPVYQESTAILLPRPPPKSKLWNVYSTLGLDVWLLTAGGLVASALCIWLLAYFSPFSAYYLQLEYAIVDEIWLQEYLWSVMGSFFQQGQDFYPSAASPRTAMAFWWMFTIIFYAFYTGDLTAHLAISVTDLPIKTLDDLVAQTAIKPQVQIGTNHYALLKESTSGIYKMLDDMITVVNSAANCSGMVFTDKTACIGGYSYLVNFAKQNCSQVYLAGEIFNTATAAFLYADDAYFADLFDFYFLKLSETGILDKLFNKYWSSDTVCTVGTSAEAASINLEGVGGCFIVALGLYCVGLIILGLELFWTRVLGKSPIGCVLY